MKPMIWAHADCLSRSATPFRRYPGAVSVFILDPGPMDADEAELKRIGFLYESALELGCAVRRGDTTSELLWAARAGGCDTIVTADSPDPAFRRGLAAEFDGRPRLHFHFAPPLFARPGPDGRPAKRRYGPWVEPLLGGLARLRFLRGTAFDPFGRTEERRQERALLAGYVADIEAMLARFEMLDLSTATAYAQVPEMIRGFGPVKQAAMAAAQVRRDALRPRLYRDSVATAPAPASPLAEPA